MEPSHRYWCDILVLNPSLGPVDSAPWGLLDHVQSTRNCQFGCTLYSGTSDCLILGLMVKESYGTSVKN